MCCTYIINSQQMIRDKCSPVLWCNLHLGMHYCSWGFQCLCHYNRSTVGNKSYFKVFCLHSSGGLFYLYKITVCVCVCFGAFHGHIAGSCWWSIYTCLTHCTYQKNPIGTLITRHNSRLIMRVPIINRLVDTISGIIRALQLLRTVAGR